VSLIRIVSLWNAIRSRKPAVVQTWMYHSDFIGGLVARLAGVSRVCWGIHHSLLHFENSKFSTILISRLNSVLSYFIPAKIICCAESAKLVHQRIGYCKWKIEVVSNGYDLSYFAPTSLGRSNIRRGLNWDEMVPVIGAVARFCPEKDY